MDFGLLALSSIHSRAPEAGHAAPTFAPLRDGNSGPGCGALAGACADAGADFHPWGRPAPAPHGHRKARSFFFSTFSTITLAA